MPSVNIVMEQETFKSYQLQSNEFERGTFKLSGKFCDGGKTVWGFQKWQSSHFCNCKVEYTCCRELVLSRSSCRVIVTFANCAVPEIFFTWHVSFFLNLDTVLLAIFKESSKCWLSKPKSRPWKPRKLFKQLNNAP